MGKNIKREEGKTTMREILFRGKEQNTGEWVYGVPIDGHMICGILDEGNRYDSLQRWVETTVESVNIDTNTIGQFTGMYDMYGIDIYGGDIIEAWSQGVKATGEVKQRTDGLWIIYPAYQEKIMWGLCPNSDGKSDVEIIGNIHDNPEKLKVKL